MAHVIRRHGDGIPRVGELRLVVEDLAVQGVMSRCSAHLRCRCSGQTAYPPMPNTPARTEMCSDPRNWNDPTSGTVVEMNAARRNDVEGQSLLLNSIHGAGGPFEHNPQATVEAFRGRPSSAAHLEGTTEEDQAAILAVLDGQVVELRDVQYTFTCASEPHGTVRLILSLRDRQPRPRGKVEDLLHPRSRTHLWEDVIHRLECLEMRKTRVCECASALFCCYLIVKRKWSTSFSSPFFPAKLIKRPLRAGCAASEGARRSRRRGRNPCKSSRNASSEGYITTRTRLVNWIVE